VLLAGLLFTGLMAAELPSQSAVHVSAAWIRWLPANLPAAGYLTLINEGDRPVALMSVDSPAYANVQLHRTLWQGGTTRMLAVPSIAIAAHSTLNFAALGYHLMLQQPRSAVAPGKPLALTLHFADGGTLRISAEVRAPSGQPSKPPAAAMPGMPGMPGMSN
jgi:copper(I)-binding protein